MEVFHGFKVKENISEVCVWDWQTRALHWLNALFGHKPHDPRHRFSSGWRNWRDKGHEEARKEIHAT